MLTTSARRSPLYDKCVAPILAQRQKEFHDRIMALRNPPPPVQVEDAENPTTEEVKYMSVTDLRTMLIQDRIYSYDLVAPRFGVLRASRKAVADYFGISEEDLIGQARSNNLVAPRQLCFYLIYMHEERSLPEIGRLFEGRDHTTILHGIRRVHVKFHGCDYKFRQAFDYIRGNIYARDEYYWAA